MGLEQRGSNRYYYRKVRRGRRVVSAYVGKGEFAALMWQADKHIKAHQEAKRQAWAAERARIESADTLVDELAMMAHDLLVETLELNGYHQHKRQWRKKRD